MTGRVLLVVAAAALLVAGVGAGVGFALVASPLAIWTALLARGDAAFDPPWVAGAAASATLLALGLGLAAQPAAWLAAGAATVLLGRVAMLTRAAPAPRPERAPLRAGAGGGALGHAAGFVAILADELARFGFRLRLRARSGASLAELAREVRALSARNAPAGSTRSAGAGSTRSAGAGSTRSAGAGSTPSAGAGSTRNVSLLHPPPPPLEKPTLRGAGSSVSLCFESALAPLDVAAASDLQASVGQGPAAPMAHATLLQHAPGAPRPTVVCIHGLGPGARRLAARRFGVADLRRRGLDVVLLELPASALGGGSGAGRALANPAELARLVSRSVFDLRRLLGWLRRQGVPALALYGEQIGGSVAALTAACDRQLAAVVVRGTPASLADPWLAEVGERDRLALSAMGLTRATLEDALRPASVLDCEPRLPADALLIVAGRRDRICTPDQSLALWEHWGRPAIHWHPGGHLLGLATPALHARVGDHLAQQLDDAVQAASLPLTRFRR